jgi:acyl-CoA synthetase (AMP-forming)/AMP-acid ligase II
MRARPLVVGLDAASVASIRQAFERGAPIGLISDKLSATDREAAVQRLAAAVPADTAFVVFTSGSTGRPKGVVLSRAAAEAAVHMSEARLGKRADDRWLLALSPAQVGGLGVLMRCWLRDLPCELAGGHGLAVALEQTRPTLLSLVPTQLSALLDDPTWRPPSSLRALLLGGAAAPQTLLVRARARGVPVLTTYGMTETFGQAATAAPHEPVPAGAIGRPLDGVRIDAGTREAPSLIRVDTPAACSAYLGEPPRSGAVPTSDLGFLEDGWLHVVGRADDIIITGGHKVHPLPIEAALSLPGVAAIAISGLPDAHWGNLLAAAIVPGADFDRAALDAAIAALPPHQRPRRLALLDHLPRLPSGKLDRAALSALLRPKSGQMGTGSCG